MSADLPGVLAAPPWRDKKRKPAKPIVLDGLPAPEEPETGWLPGERERWLTGHGAGWVPEQGWESVLPAIDSDNDVLVTYFAAYAPDELVRPRLGTWTPPLGQADNRARTFIAKYETLALPAVLALGRRPAERAQLLQPFVSPEIAVIMADGLVRLRSMRGHATAWLRRHSDAAVRCLLPTALGKPGKPRQNAVAALRLLEADGLDVVAIAQSAHGEDVAVATKQVLADRGLDTYPRTVPPTPAWARAELLSQIRLRDGQTALPHSAAQAVVEMLMFSKPGAPYPGLECAKEVCDASSLAEFAWSLAESWEQSGSPDKDLWAFRAVGLLGDETTATRLGRLTRDWYAESRAEHVYEAFNALAAIGGDRSLAELHVFAHRAWTAKTKRRAQAAFDDVAQARDLTADQLADRLVPALGVSTQDSIRLDYGRRRFDVSINDSLQLLVTDETGAVLRTVPKPGKRDDPDLAAAAYQRFCTLKKEVQDLATRQSARLEKAMIRRRRWFPEEFTTYLVGHPLLCQIVRRLVWGVYAEDGPLLGTFRVAEDLSFADVDDARYEVPEGALIGVAHPVDLGHALTRWSEVFADYEILQPFEQLGRPPLVLTDEERAGTRLVRSIIRAEDRIGVIGRVQLSPNRVEHLVSLGWQRGPVGAGRLWSRLLRPVGAGRYVVVDLDPGLEGGAPTQSRYQEITAVWLSKAPDGSEPATGGEHQPVPEQSDPFGTLDPVTASAILRDLAEVTAQ